jgi:hypothetical protein
VTILDAPTWVTLTDAVAAGADQLTATVRRNADGHAVRVYRRALSVSTWTLAGTVAAGSGSTTGTLTIEDLTPGEQYETLLVSVDGTDISLPSSTKRAIPTDGSGSFPERAVANLTAAVETITMANGYPWTLAAVYRGGPEPLKAVGYPHAFVEADECSGQDFATVGGQGQQEVRLGVTVWLVTKKYDAPGFPQKEAIRFFSAVTRAVMEHPQRGGVAIDTVPVRWSAFHATEDSPMTGIGVRFELWLRYARDNPETALPT